MPSRSLSSLTMAAAATAMLLAGCRSSDVASPVCPRVFILADAATLTAFAPGAGTDILDVDYEVEIADVLSGCQVDRSDKRNPVLTVAVAPILVVGRGAANRDGTASFAFFVSAVNRDDAITNKVDFPLAVKFEGNRNRIVLREDDPPITVNIPLVGTAEPFDYEVVVGMQLTRPQLEYNQARRADFR